jgi:uncharacterized membrane protein (UPF0127 family)
MKKFSLLFLFLILITAIAFALSSYKSVPQAEAVKEGYEHEYVVLGNSIFDSMVADTNELRTQGLSGFSGLEMNEAMLFKFNNEGYWSFWMKGMKFSIDMIWLNASSTIVSIEKNVSPNTYPRNFSPKAPAQYVIEVLAGTVDRVGLKVGDKVPVQSKAKVGN